MFDQEPFERGAGHGRRVQETLHQVAPRLVEEAALAVGLDPFGHRDDAEVVGQGQDRPGDRPRAPLAQVADERPVDLEGVERQGVQVRQRRVAGAEVVQGDEEAQVVELLEAAGRGPQVLDQQALGDLELELRRRDPGLVERGGQTVGEVALLELRRRDVDRDAGAARQDAVPGPAGDVAGDGGDHQVAHRADRAGRLGGGDED